MNLIENQSLSFFFFFSFLFLLQIFNPEVMKIKVMLRKCLPSNEFSQLKVYFLVSCIHQLKLYYIKKQEELINICIVMSLTDLLILRFLGK